MADRVPFNQGEDVDKGVEVVYDMWTQFMSSHAWELAPVGILREEIEAGMRDIWAATAVETTAIKASIVGPLKNADDEQISVIIAMVVTAKLNQYRMQLPAGVLGGS